MGGGRLQLAALVGGVGEHEHRQAERRREEQLRTTSSSSAATQHAAFEVGAGAVAQLRFRGYFTEQNGEPALYPRDAKVRATRVRHVELTYHMTVDGRAGEVDLREVGSQQVNAGNAILTGDLPNRVFRDPEVQGQTLLARQRVVMPREGITFQAAARGTLVGNDGQPLPYFQHHTPPPFGARMNAAALLGIRRVHGEHDENLSAGLTNAAAVGFMRKLHWPELPDGQFLQPHELFPGAAVPILGRSIYLIEALDEPTTRWLTLMGLPTSAGGVKAPEDSYIAHLRACVAREQAERVVAKASNPDNDEIRRRQYQGFVAKPGLRGDGRKSGKLAPPPPSEKERQQRAMTWSGRVVHFYGIHEPATPRRKFMLSYYFGDETVQVVELLPANSGDSFAVAQRPPRTGEPLHIRGGGLPSDRSGGLRSIGLEAAIFLKRCRVPKDILSLRSSRPAFEHGRWLGVDGQLPADATSFVELEDLRVGATIPIMGMELRVVGCEPSSRSFLSKNFRLQIGDDQMPVEDFH